MVHILLRTPNQWPDAQTLAHHLRQYSSSKLSTRARFIHCYPSESGEVPSSTTPPWFRDSSAPSTSSSPSRAGYAGSPPPTCLSASCASVWAALPASSFSSSRDPAYTKGSGIPSPSTSSSPSFWPWRGRQPASVTDRLASFFSSPWDPASATGPGFSSASPSTTPPSSRAEPTTPSPPPTVSTLRTLVSSWKRTFYNLITFVVLVLLYPITPLVPRSLF